MTQIRLGKTEIVTNKNGFGALPIQRISFEDADALIMHAYENGITFFDTARFYTDSEKKLGKSLCARGLRDKVYIASKTMCTNTEQFWSQLETSLADLQTDYLDLYQFHNPAFCPKPCDGTGLYEAMLEAKAQGKIRHIGITNHRLSVAEEAIESGLYETLQFPFSYLASDEEIALAEKCRKADMGFIAMKGMSGGLIKRADAAYAFMSRFENVLPIWGVQKMEELKQFLACEKNPPVMNQEMKTFIADAAYAFMSRFENVLPIWGVQKMEELKQFLACEKNPPVMNQEMKTFIETERRELSGEFCRGCGYCMPCPVGIKINDCARMSLMIRRASIDIYMDEAHQAEMEAIEKCLHCGQCAAKCPYGLDTPKLLEKNLKDYRQQLSELGNNRIRIQITIG